MASTSEYQEGENIKYPYPYFSDEWYAIAFVKQSITNHVLPFKNPFYPESSFVNLEFISHSFISEITLLLRLDPVLDYTKLTIGFNMLIILLIYLFLRFIAITPGIAGISALLTLFITNGANLPGIWNLIPLTTGLIMLLISLCYFESKNLKMITLSSFLTLIFYPPLFVFIAPAFVCFVIKNRNDLEEKPAKIFLKYLLVILTAALLVSLTFLFVSREIVEIVKYIFSKLFYTSFTGIATPRFSFWHVVPWAVLPLAGYGLVINYKKQKRWWLKSMLVVGSLYWIAYSIASYRVIIDFERVIFATAIILIIFSGIGLQRLADLALENEFVVEYKIVRWLEVISFLLIFSLSFVYTYRDQWQELTLYHPELKGIFLPAAPANEYLTQDDLRIFENIKEDTFLSPPWKGTVIGVATNNLPRCAKPGTITISPNSFKEFTESDCDGKDKIAQSVRYFYVPKMDCKNFILKDKSKEGLFLYEHKKLKKSHNIK
ncbi:hypothetical protein HN747_04830 [archaeon]|nr:hypothetical protein [archaeon]